MTEKESWWTSLTKDRPELTWSRFFHEDPILRLLRSKKTSTGLGFASKAAKSTAVYLAATGNPVASATAYGWGIGLGAASSFAYSAQAADKQFLPQPPRETNGYHRFRRKSGFVSMPRKSLKSTSKARRGRRKRAQRNRTLARRVAKLERSRQRKFKTVDTTSLAITDRIQEAQGTDDTSGWFIYNFTYPTQGDGVSEREGREFRPVSLYIRGQVYIPSNASSYQVAQGMHFRLILVQDMRNAQQKNFTVSNSTTVLVTEFLEEANNILSLYNMDSAENFGRFQVIFDEKFIYSGETGSSSTSAGSYIPFERMIKKRLRPITFAATGTGGDYTYVEKGHLTLLAAYSSEFNLTNDPSVQLTYRWRWTQD